MKVLEQRATTEEENKTLRVSPEKTISFSAQSNDQTPPMPPRATPIESCQVASENTDEFDQKPPLFLDDIFKDSFESSNVTLDNHNELHHDQWLNAIGAVWDQNPVMLDEKFKVDHDVVSSATSSNIVSDDNCNTNKVSSLRLSIGDVMLRELELPKSNMDWTQDSFWTQLCSPWLDNLMLTSPYANILNF